jgi:outer membrane protein assembly factor BamA
MAANSLTAQQNYQFIIVDKDDNTLLEKQITDTLTIYNFLDSIQKVDFAKGHILSSVDNWKRKDSVHTINYYQGPAFKWGQIRYDRSQEWMEAFLDYELRELEGKTLRIDQLQELNEKMIARLENSGYPFAAINLDSISVDSTVLESYLKVDRGPFITFDTIKNIGTSQVSNNYLTRYLGIEKNAVYDKRAIADLENKLREISFFKMKDPPKIAFVNNKAEVLLNLAKSKSSHFDFIIGLLQNNTGTGQRFTVVTDFTAEMRNQLGYGERFFLSFERLRPENQKIDLAFDYPYLLDTPFGVSFKFGQFRNEDLWIDRYFELGAQYYFQGRDYLNVSWNNRVSNLIEIDTMQLLQTERLPTNLDFSYNGITIGFLKENLDYRFNPSKGYEVSLSTNAGLKRIRPNVTIQNILSEDVNFIDSYDSLQLNTYQLGLELDASYFIPLARSVTIKTGVRSAYQFNEVALFQNDLYRIGGNRILRGFDEQSILSSFYSVFTAELRFILAQESNNFTLALPFVDYAAEYNPLRLPDERWDTPLGIGVGMNFETSAGIFSFAMAIGKRLDNPFDFGDLKIHFGYVNLF